LDGFRVGGHLALSLQSQNELNNYSILFIMNIVQSTHTKDTKKQKEIKKQ